MTVAYVTVLDAVACVTVLVWELFTTQCYPFMQLWTWLADASEFSFPCGSLKTEMPVFPIFFEHDCKALKAAIVSTCVLFVTQKNAGKTAC